MILMSGELGPTLTYSRRSWSWLGRTGAADLPNGTVTINLQHGGRRSKVESDQYDVQELPAEGHVGRVFLFLRVPPVKPDAGPETVREPDPPAGPDAHAKDIYEVYVGDDGRLTACNCKAGECRVPGGCKHRDAVIALIAAGAFDPDIDPPAYPDPTEEELDDMAASFSAYDSGLWFPPAAPADDEPLPACFQGIGGSADRAPF